MSNRLSCLRRLFLFVFVLIAVDAAAQDPPPVGSRKTALPPAVPAGSAASLGQTVTDGRGLLQVVVRLSAPAMIDVVDEGAFAEKTVRASRSRQRNAQSAARQQQARLAAQAATLGAQTLAGLEKSLNALVMRVEASRIVALRQLPDVVSVKPVGRYSTGPEEAPPSDSLAQAAQYLQASGPRAQGFTGLGVTVAVFDSGVDFTHKNLGGPATPAFYSTCYTGSGTPAAHTQLPTGACASYFGPAAPKVIGGFDFVGETWDGTLDNEAPDPNPIDSDGHGTHVADIAAGRSLDGTHEGLAPGAKLYAYKVCSAVTSSCSGLALLQAVEAALDPNADGDMDDAPDVWNFSLGSLYGQPEDDLSFVLNQVVRAGIVVVAAAGNWFDKPWIVSSPSTAPNVISVAQTSLPDDVLYPVVVNSPVIQGLPDNTVKNAVPQSWAAPLLSPITAALVRPAQVLGCDAASFAGFPLGAVALIDRGVCNVSIKVGNAKEAGASAAVIANNAPGAPPSFSYGGGDTSIPAVVISQADGALLKSAQGPVSVTLDPANAIELTATMIADSARGPAIDDARVKPDIGAPGAWLSAEVGTGDTVTDFGGTSGAAPTVTGAAAILLQRYPKSTPLQIKRRLVNNADTGTRTADLQVNLYATPISRIGGGEVRVGPAVEAEILAGDPGNGSGNLSLGVPYVTDTSYVLKKIRLRNTSNGFRAVTLSQTFRDPADASLGAISLIAPAVVPLAPRAQVDVPIVFAITGSNLNPWPFVDPLGFGLAGLLGNDGTTLNGPELDGYLEVKSSGGDSVHLGWHVLPHRASWVTSPRQVRVNPNGFGGLRLSNRSEAESGLIEVFGLTGVSDELPKPAPGEPGTPGSNQPVIDIAGVGVRDFVADNVIQFGISTFDRRKTPLVPAGFEIQIDTNRDGDVDYVVYNGPIAGNFTDGRSVVNVFRVATNTSTAFFFTDADFDSGNVVFTVPLSALGLAQGSTFDMIALAYDNYSTLVVTDAVVNMTWTVGQPRYRVADGETLSLPPDTEGVATVQAGPGTISSQTGFLLMFRNNRNPEFGLVAVTGGPAATLTSSGQEQ